MILTGILYVISTVSWLSLILGSLMIGAAAASTFHGFRPYSNAWSWQKTFAMRLMNGALTLVVIYMCLWGRFLEYGALMEDNISWAERASGFLLAAMGFIIAGIILGKGQFQPDAEVLTSR
jgi:hypothetical protein